jgi:hypothetical protein
MRESERFDWIKRKHESLLAYLEQASLTAEEAGALENRQEPRWIAEATRFLREVSTAGRHISNLHRRSHLRAILRYWEDQIYETTGEMLKIELQPALEEPSYEGTAYQPVRDKLQDSLNQETKPRILPRGQIVQIGVVSLPALALFAILYGLSGQLFASLIVAVAAGTLLSIYLVSYRRAGLLPVIVAWLVVGSIALMAAFLSRCTVA